MTWFGSGRALPTTPGGLLEGFSGLVTFQLTCPAMVVGGEACLAVTNRKMGNTGQSRHNETGPSAVCQRKMDFTCCMLMFRDSRKLICPSSCHQKIVCLKLSGERKVPADWESSSWQKKERRFGSFEKSMAVARRCRQSGNICQSNKRRVLTVTVPKKQPEPEVEDAEDISIN